MKHCKKAIALLLSVLMTLSLFSVVGFAGDDDSPEPNTDPEPTMYTVTFHKDAGDDLSAGTTAAVFGDPQSVAAGEDADDPLPPNPANPLLYDDDVLRTKLNYPKYSKDSFHTPHFNGWDKPLTNIQSNLDVYPTFTPIGKRYIIHYFDYSGKTEYNSEGCTFGQTLMQIPEAKWNADPLRYRYEFVGWALKPNLNPDNEDDAKYLLDWSDSLSFPSDQDLGQNEEQPDYIDVCGKKVPDGQDINVNVYACFRHYDKEYRLSLTVVDQYGYTVPNANVQITGDNGQLLDQTFAQRDENGNLVNRKASAAGATDGNGRLSMLLPYQNSYHIAVTYYGSDASGKANETITLSQMQNLETNNAIGRTITLKKETERCNCICHSFLGGVWVRVLNLLYDFLKVKYVCCNDMYATHKGQLAYGA